MGIVKKEKSATNGVIIENLFHESQSLLKTSYNYNTNQLVVTFKKGTVYGYNAVPVNVYEGLKSAESTGSYFNSQIVKVFPAKKIGEIDSDTLGEMQTVISESKG